MIRECIHCKKSRGLGSDVLCSEGHPYESYMRETECPYFEINRRSIKMNKEEINKLTAKIESCWDENNPGDVRSFDERLKEKLTPEEYELITSWG